MPEKTKSIPDFVISSLKPEPPYVGGYGERISARRRPTNCFGRF